MKTTGPFAHMAKQAAVVRERSHKIAELRLMQKELRGLSQRAFTIGYPLLGDTLLNAAAMAGNLTDIVEEA